MCAIASGRVPFGPAASSPGLAGHVTGVHRPRPAYVLNGTSPGHIGEKMSKFEHLPVASFLSYGKLGLPSVHFWKSSNLMYLFRKNKDPYSWVLTENTG